MSTKVGEETASGFLFKPFGNRPGEMSFARSQGTDKSDDGPFEEQFAETVPEGFRLARLAIAKICLSIIGESRTSANLIFTTLCACGHVAFSSVNRRA